MKESLGFLKICSLVVKIGAWALLVVGLVGGASIVMGQVPGSPKWMGAVILLLYVFLFFLLQLIAKIPDLLTKIIDGIKKEQVE